jgi:hypothetical protein
MDITDFTPLEQALMAVLCGILPLLLILFIFQDWGAVTKRIKAGLKFFAKWGGIILFVALLYVGIAWACPITLCLEEEVEWWYGPIISHVIIGGLIWFLYGIMHCDD